MDEESELAEALGIDLSGRQPVVSDKVGHNNKYELDRIAEKARRGLEMVRQGEEDTVSGWVTYGESLIEGRDKFPEDDRAFGFWKQGNIYTNLVEIPHQNDEVAAMWAAHQPEELRRILEEYPKVRTVRGAKAKFDEEKKAEEREANRTPPVGNKVDETPTNTDTQGTEGKGDTNSENVNTSNTGNIFGDIKPDPDDVPKKPKTISLEPYNVANSMGAIKGVAENFSKRYEGTKEEAAQTLLEVILEEHDRDQIGYDIAKNYAKWFLNLKEVLDLVQPELESFLDTKPNLTVVK